ncbi:MAG: Fe/S biogenesis protein NfuA [Porticoccaceae bacterium]|nr:MAG: Fe/S biogenesis protein NfuA [Porticoccaceae bacterium]
MADLREQREETAAERRDERALLESIEFTAGAVDYLADLLAKQECEGIAIRMFVADPGTPRAETCIAYCRPGEEQEDDLVKDLGRFRVFIERRSLPFLEDARVDFSPDRFGGQLTIRAPNSRLPKVRDDSPLEDKINYYLQTEINPQLAAHGGMVTLEAVEDGVAVLRFGGGCQGCGMVDLTLKEGVERTLRERIPELAGVRDVTDHADRSHAYY